jgi:hypothetical protein
MLGELLQAHALAALAHPVEPPPQIRGRRLSQNTHAISPISACPRFTARFDELEPCASRERPRADSDVRELMRSNGGEREVITPTIAPGSNSPE